jgi:NAD(P)H-dependent flavin oxidoreductase YrpB (nitropropane dioxygenase family)
MSAAVLPEIIQGGMGIAVSDWRLANAVSRCGQLGVVSGTALDSVFVRRLQDGDPGGHARRAMAHFPIAGAAERVQRRFFREGGRAAGTAYALLPMFRARVEAAREQLTMLANFVEVFLAKEGHEGPVGINLLTKIQLPNLASLYGAMLAGVDYVLMGAGIPREVPAALDALASHRPAQLRLEVEAGAIGTPDWITFDPARHLPSAPDLRRPAFLPIVASVSLATMLARKATGRVDGFVVEGPTAGGHNAPPRGGLQLDDQGQPVYGPRDVVDLAKLAELGLPFWLAGGTGSPQALRQARASGAAGIQVGTLFAYCQESGLAPELKRSVLDHAARGAVRVRTDPRASPTGFPFKVVSWSDDPAQSGERQRICDLGYLRVAYRTPDGKIGFRCAAEPVDSYVAKGGDPADAECRRCLCNALMANIGLPQLREAGPEPPLLTSGDDLAGITGFLRGRTHYRAADVIAFLQGADGDSSGPAELAGAGVLEG